LGHPEARYIWTDETGEGLNRWALLRRTFTLSAAPSAGELNLFADTRYRLLINGHVVGHGPARFFLARPEYDTHDLAPYLREGENVIAVLVNSYGCSSFHSETSTGGLIAWGEAADEAGRSVRIVTDPSWRAIDSPAHLSDTPSLSFALNPGEHLDGRDWPVGWELPGFSDAHWPVAVVRDDQNHWGELRPRSIPLLDEREALPRRRIGTWAARYAPDEQIHSFLVRGPGGNPLRAGGRVAAMTHLHSPRRQMITFGAWWGRYWINGEELKPIRRDDLYFRQDFTAELREGWNLLQVHESYRNGWWDFHLALPAEAALTIAAEPRPDCPHTFLIGGPWEHEAAEAAKEMPLPLASPAALPEPLGPWRRWPRGRGAQAPCRERAWKTFGRIDDDPSLDVDVARLAERVGDGALSVLLDFGGEVLGRPVVEFTAAAGTVVDLTYAERLRGDGVADVHRRCFVDMAERYVARAGRQQWQTFHPRGFRYLELLIDGELSAFELHRAAATRALYPVDPAGRFECSDPALNAIWRLGRDTAAACMEDVYLDCPWRERGLYGGDLLVEFQANRAAFGDTKLMRRCIELFLLGQGDSGLVPGGAHGLPPGRHPDYSAILLMAARDYWAATGDVESLRQWRDRLSKLAAGLDGLPADANGLIDGSDLDAYIDLSHMDRGGVNCALNCFCQRGLSDAARIFDLLGEADESRRWADRAERLGEAVRRGFWDEARGVFVDRLVSDVPETAPSVAANALPLLYDLATPTQAERALTWLLGAMQSNFRVPDPEQNSDCNVTSYFSYYALGVLYKHRRVVEAERFIRKYWGHMLDQGAWCCWEYFAGRGSASRCHGWSAGPTHYLSTRVLGVTLPEPGNANRVEIRPQPGTLQWAEGTYPHPAGPIHVRWRRRAGRLDVQHDAPDGVVVEVRRER